MPAVPKVIFLYDNDAVEVRYSDDSRLELSPCGAAMIFHPPSKPGEHPRHCLSQQLHKRTQFVTSEHRLKVLQALDFRNRFARRPYLCEDLLNSQDVVSLYASVDVAKWPKSSTQAKLDILPDGSRKVTSLDEFASLIVSPHGQDFSVCYLSKVSSECASHNSPQPLSTSLPVHTSKLITKYSHGRRSHRKTSEAVVYPYSHEQNECYEETKHVGAHHDQRNVDMHFADEKQENDQNTKRHFQFHKEHQEINVPNHVSSLPNENFVFHEHSCQVNSQGCTEIPPPTLAIESNFQPSSDIQSDLSQARQVQSPLNSSTSRMEGKIVVSDRCSPLPHEISSISRCSSPDGLRMTIDSDTTLTHDMTDNETIQYRQRHSSPTQMCTNVEDIQLPFARLVELKSSLVQGSLSSLPSDNQPQFPFAQVCINTSDRSPTPVHENAVNSSSTQPSFSDRNETSNSDSPHSTTLCHSQQDRSPIREKISNKEAMQNPDLETCTVEMPVIDQAGGTVTSLQRSHQNNYNHHCPTTVHACRGNSLQSSHSMDTRESGAGNEIRDRNSFSSQAVSSNVNLDLGNKSPFKRKYVWTTSHASRNDCPKEWTHPLMLALQGTSSANTGKSAKESLPSHTDKSGCYESFLPRPLPLNCPFQHTHRSTAQDDNRNQNQSSELSTNLGIFQRGRLKVVLSEGIIYRLISASGMTVVEVYPGDGSMLISQGAKGLFFTHYIPQQGQLEERMYSLKSLPPRCSKEFRPIEKMLKTANRFLHICLNWDKRTDKRYSPCWQKEMVAVVEPLSSSVLEECVIDGLGKFTAYTNGRVRIVFEDRTSLNAVFDFSTRTESAAKIPNSDLEDGTVRLLLPSGNYVLVEKNSNGPYSRYLKIAREWTDWVNTSPAERHKFYTRLNQPSVLDQAAKLELKKINCFNYILENTFQPIQQQNRATKLQSSVDFPGSSHKSFLSHSQANTDTLPSPASSDSPHFQHNYTSYGHGFTAASNSNLDKTSLGFLSVKQALAQTSSMIRDIEDFLEDNKT